MLIIRLYSVTNILRLKEISHASCILYEKQAKIGVEIQSTD